MTADGIFTIVVGGVRLKKVLRMAWAFGLLGVLLYGAYALISTGLKALSEVNPQFSGAVTAAVATLIVAVVTVVGGKWLERKALIAKELRDKKVPVYEDLIEFIFKVFNETNQGKSTPPDEFSAFFFEFTQRLIIWGSDEVVCKWVAFRRSTDGEPQVLLAAMENVLEAIRRDLGHKNSNLKSGDLLSLFFSSAKHEVANEGAKA